MNTWASLALALIAYITAPAAAQAGQPVPFRATWEANITIAPLAPPLVAVAGQGAGQALHLGAMAAQSIADTVNLATGEGFAAYRFIATNGDEAGNRVRSVLLTNTVLAHRLAPGPDR
ncbi:MAG: hypothetical protein M5U12_19185 [Verrucomicrobia bacterium]|nr:hypothetical protein [Verrucomicrobiota bacterium]